MLVLVTYDITDPQRLRRVAKVSEGFGRRVQKSVFECEMDEKGIVQLRRALEDVMDPQVDSVRFYRLCGRCRGSVEVMGIGTLPREDDLVVL
ncbi:MAG TPA: CRISPR-associated endonuclease Cas2 [Myxococcota bacterium]|nr:CRISPR-associated endonuclease Cas2 [Myxococcota bacterium]